MRPIPGRRWMVAAAAVAAVALAGAYAPALAETHGTARPVAAPGDLVSAEPFTAYQDPGKLFEVPAQAWKLHYTSTSAIGEANQVSGALLVPTADWTGDGERPIIGYSVGTHGLGDQCAPSHKLAEGTENEAQVMNTLLRQGWAVAVTDYEGLGTPGLHTYAVGRSEGHAALDIVRAASKVSGAGLSADAPVGLWGYSQGGQSTSWAAQLAASYAPELKIKGAAPGGVPADLISIARDVDGGPYSALVLAAGLGYDAAYPELDLEKYLNEEGRKAAEDAKDDCVEDAAAKYAFRPISDFTTSNPLETEAWQTRLNENRLGGSGKPSMPVYLYQGLADNLVPYQQAAQLRKEWCDNGATVEWTRYPGEHITTYVEAVPAAALWMRSRLAGEPTEGNCGLP